MPPYNACALFDSIYSLIRACSRISIVDVFCRSYVALIYIGAKLLVNLSVFVEMQLVHIVQQDAMCRSLWILKVQSLLDFPAKTVLLPKILLKTSVKFFQNGS